MSVLEVATALNSVLCRHLFGLAGEPESFARPGECFVNVLNDLPTSVQVMGDHAVLEQAWEHTVTEVTVVSTEAFGELARRRWRFGQCVEDLCCDLT